MANLIDETEDALIVIALVIVAVVIASLVGATKDFKIDLPDWLKNPLGAIPWSPAKPGDEGYDDPKYNPDAAEVNSNAIEPNEKAIYNATDPLTLPYVEQSIAENQTAESIVSAVPDQVFSDTGKFLADNGLF